MSLTCWKCTNMLRSDASFCPNCGSASAPSKPSVSSTTSTPYVPPRPPGPTSSRVAIPTAPTTEKKMFGRSVEVQGIPEEIILKNNEQADLVMQGLHKYYANYIRPLEDDYKFGAFHSHSLNEVDFKAAPSCLLIGGYSVGKTTMIDYMLEKPYPSAIVGPEPTTSRMVAVMHGNEEKTIPGNALAAMADAPYQQLQQFGMNFLNNFEGAVSNAPILKKITFIDTPGILSGEASRINRNYDFPRVIKWFADRCDRIILMFDAHKLDISDEFKTVIEALSDHHDKMRFLVNKSDLATRSELTRIYGSLMWNLGRIITSPEVPRVYVASCWSQPLRSEENRKLLLQEEADLLADLRSLPRNHALRMVNDVVKRARHLKVHILILDHLRAQFGYFGKKSKQKKLLAGMLEHFKSVQSKNKIPTGDFPRMSTFVSILEAFEIWKFPEASKKKLAKLDWVLSTGIPELLKMAPPPLEVDGLDIVSAARGASSNIMYGHSSQYPPEYVSEDAPVPEEDTNPFAEEEAAPMQWIIPQIDQTVFTEQFYSLHLSTAKLAGSVARPLLLKLGVSAADLRAIWTLADVDKDGSLDLEEYILCRYLIQKKQLNPSFTIPSELVAELIPPTHREDMFSRARAAGQVIRSVATQPHLNPELSGQSNRALTPSPATAHDRGYNDLTSYSSPAYEVALSPSSAPAPAPAEPPQHEYPDQPYDTEADQSVPVPAPAPAPVAPAPAVPPRVPTRPRPAPASPPPAAAAPAAAPAAASATAPATPFDDSDSDDVDDAELP